MSKTAAEITKRQCAICGKEVKLFRGKKLSDGSYLCTFCQSYIPYPFLKERYITTEEMKTAFEYGKLARETLSSIFAATAQYGRMFLDEKHGLFVICDATNIAKTGKLKKSVNEIYHCLSIENASFSLCPVLYEQTRVKCRVLFGASLPKCGHMVIPIKQQAYCRVSRNDDGTITYCDPNDLMMFRNVYRQMVENELRAFSEEIKRREERKNIREEARKEKEESERRQILLMREEKIRDAMTLFMLGESYTEEELKHQRALFMRAFHPDNKNVINPVYAQKINEAYEILLDELKKERR